MRDRHQYRNESGVSAKVSASRSIAGIGAPDISRSGHKQVRMRSPWRSLIFLSFPVIISVIFSYNTPVAQIFLMTETPHRSSSLFEVTRQAFHHAALAYAIVNLRVKPIVPGRTCPAPSLHAILSYQIFPDVLMCPTRPVPHITDLHMDELLELIRIVQCVCKAHCLSEARLHHVFCLFSFTDVRWMRLSNTGPSPIGQNIPHVHFHVLRRRLQGNQSAECKSDEELEKREGALRRTSLRRFRV